MLIKDLDDCKEFIAGDKTILRELLHSTKDKLDLQYSLAHATVKYGQRSKAHKLRSSEVYYILEGEGIMFIGDRSAKVHAGQTIYIPPNTIQYIKNTSASNLKFLCIVNPAWQPEDEEMLS